LKSTFFSLPDVFDFIPYAKLRAEENMAMDETLLHSVIAGERQAVFRIYGWDKPSITLGQFQKSTGLDLKRCERDGIPVIRRITGGRGVYHHNELCYCVIAQGERPILTDKKKVFGLISGIIARGLSQIGIESHVTSKTKGETGNPNCFEATSLCEIVNERGEKIVGSAMLVQNRTVMAQGSIPLDDTYKMMSAYLKDRELMSKAKSKRAVSDDIHDVATQFTEGMSNVLTLRLTELRPDEKAKMNSLIVEKYLTDSWNFQR